jgi:hypothetical protein
MNQDGFKALLSGFNAGQPEKEHWKLMGMRRYLELCAEYPDEVAISLHAGKTNGNKNDPIADFFPHMIGRFLWLHEACDEMGIPRPQIFMSEWAWSYNDMPEPAAAMEDLAWLAKLYAPYPNVRGAFLWCLQGGREWASLPNMLVRLMGPVTEKTLHERIIIEQPPDDPPNEMFDEKVRRLAGEHQVIHFNREAALQAAMTRDGFVQMSEEYRFEAGGVKFVAQSAYNLEGHPERIYWCVDGQWSNVNWLLLIDR